MKEEIKKLISAIQLGAVTDEEIQHITDRIRLSIKEDSTKGKELGEFLARIKQTSKAKKLHKEVNWVQVGKGFLAIGHKPGGKISFEGLKSEGTSAILTLLQENEGAHVIGKKSEMVNIEWLWFPFSASKPHEGEALAQVYELYTKLSNQIFCGAKIYIHCSAGIHRTGMITYGFLRFLGQGKTEAYKTLQSLREVTADQVGEDRLLWADQFDLKKS